MTTLADKVREHCCREVVEPARRRGATTVSIRSGDVHGTLGFKNRMPLVCSALGTQLFEELCDVQRIAVDGPLNGANTVFTFRLLPIPPGSAKKL